MRHAVRLAFILGVSVLALAAGPGSWSPSGNCTGHRYDHHGCLLSDGRVLVTSGQSDVDGVFLDSARLFQAPSTWTDAAPMNGARSVHTQTLLADGRVLVTGGRTITLLPGGGGIYNYLNSAEIYTPATNTWTTVAPMTLARGMHRATLLTNGKVLVTGGYPAGNSTEIYDPAANTWTAAAPMIYSRYSHAAVRLADGKVLVAATQLGSMQAEAYDPATNSWSIAGSPGLGGYVNQAFLLPDGRVLAFDGIPFLYTPSTNSWVQGAWMPVAVSNFGVNLLKDGRLMVTGGLQGGMVSTVQVYDPVADAWTLDASMGKVRASHVAVTLADGRVVVAGGFSVEPGMGGGATITTELYTPPAAPDTTPPVITAPASVVGEQTSPAGASVVIPVSALDAVDGPVAVTSDAPATFPPGLTTVHFTAVDHAGNAGHATTSVYVVDTTAPQITSLTASPGTIWPPSGKLVKVSLTVSATDAADPAPKSVIRSVSSNCPQPSGSPDWIVTGPLTVQLRAEKNARGGTRVYTVVVRCTDASGNFSDKSVTVSVSH